MDSKVIRLNKNCLYNIQKIRDLVPHFADPKVFDISKCSNSYIVEYALYRYADELALAFDMEHDSDFKEVDKYEST
jgi:hypothetical protein